jgi:hypothetical protein
MFEQESMAVQTRVVDRLQNGPESGVVRNTLMVTLVPEQASKAVGVSKFGVGPHCTVLFGAQVMTGGVVSTMVTVCVQVDVLVQQSAACQVMVST